MVQERINNLVTISVSEGKLKFGTDVDLDAKDVARIILDQVFEGKSQQEASSLIESCLDTPWPKAPTSDYNAGLKFFGKTLGIVPGLDSVDRLLKEVGRQLREKSE